MSRRILRAEIPVDDRAHPVAGRIVHVATRRADVVEVWFEEPRPEEFTASVREYVVVGTGHAVPDPSVYVGSAIAPGGALVWHLLDVGPFDRPQL